MKIKLFTSSARPLFLWAILASVSIGIWFNIVGYSSSFATQADSLTTLLGGRYGFFIASLLSMILLACFEKPMKRLEPIIRIAAPLVLFIGTGLFGLSSYQTLIDPSILAVIGCMTMGFSYAWFLLSLYRIVSTHGTLGDLALFLLIATALKTIIHTIIMFYIPEAAQIIIAASLAFVFSLAFYMVTKATDKCPMAPDVNFETIQERKSEGSLEATMNLQPDSANPASSLRETVGKTARLLKPNEWSHILQIFCLTIAMMTMRGLGQGGIWGNIRTAQPSMTLEATGTLLLMVFMYVVIATLALRLHVKRPYGYAYHMPILVLIAGMMFLAGAEGSIGENIFFRCFSSALELFCQTMFTLTMLVGMRRLPFSPFTVGSVALGSSYILAIVWMSLLEGSDVVSHFIILAVCFLLIFTVTSPRKGYLSDDSIFEIAQTGPPVDIYEAIVSRGRSLAREHGLTNRETEVLILLLQGRSLPYIQDELVLANGTVRTYTTHIYKKLSVHSRQELFNLASNTKTEI